jgi:predicted glycosyltransferase
MNGAKKPLRVLVSPLDWGLGHATRCIPLVKNLCGQGCEVVLACSGNTGTLLAAEFPGLSIKPLNGYQIHYSSGASLFGSLLLQLPGILRSIKQEHQWLEKTLAQEHFDLVVSDNRPGLWNKKVKSIYITHQLHILTGKGKWLDNRLQGLHTGYMKHFDEVWVPDTEGNTNLAGELSHPVKQMIQPTYLGLLSRFTGINKIADNDLLVLLSGPEPQRSLLEEKLYTQLKSFNGKVVFVRGLPQQTSTKLPLFEHITTYNHLPALQLEQIMASSKLVICRSGYTTLMDLVKLRQKALLIPTPGQPEQEYLARYMQQQQVFPFVLQKDFDLLSAINTAAAFQFHHPFTNADFDQNKSIIAQIVSRFSC